MKIFNRIVVTLLFAGLFVLGLYGVMYSFNLLGYQLADLPDTLGLANLSGQTQSLAEGVAGGNLGTSAVAGLVLTALVGLILLLFELKPPRPRLVRLQPKGTYITRRAVGEETTTAAEQTPEVLQANARVKARRGPGARIKLRSNVRRGEDLRALRSSVESQVQRVLEERGVPVSKLKVETEEAAPQGTRSRVK
jgi:hypothetical protein